MRNGPWGERIPTREEAITAAAGIYLEEKIRIETERMQAAAGQKNALVDEQVDEGEINIQGRN